ncbi:LysM peptidoglycan-binding domain-containing protein [Mycolicibacterium litorale]|uniref:LysM peptidoglycan-binding domain-containing protein n=1 Tax=Mycolicibacterium litorale TaxID=758802 RepID=UPI003CEBCEA0
MPPAARSVWKLEQVQGPSAAHKDSDIAAVSRFEANSEAFWFAPQPAVRAAFWYDDGQGWRPYSVPARLPNAPTSGIAALSRIPNSMESWWISGQGTVEGAFWYDDGKGWRHYQDAVAGPGAASPSSGVAALSRIASSMELWWVGIDGSVQGGFWYDDTTPTWQRYPVTGFGAASTASGVAAASRYDDNMEIWWIGPQGSVEGAFWYDDGKNWRRYGAPVAPNGSAAQAHCIDAVARTRDSMDVLWISPNGEVRWAHWRHGSDWQMDPNPVAPANSASAASGISVINRDFAGMEAVWVSPDGSVHGASWTATTGWQPYPGPVAGPGSASTTGGITGQARAASTVEIFWVAPDGSVQVAVRDDASLPRTFRLLRPRDLLDLRCTAVGCRLVGDHTAAPAMEYTVVRGDTLWDIAEQFYGDPRLYPIIVAANDLPDPDVIEPGQVLVIPARPTPDDPPVTYVVQEGDTLWDIATRFYGNPLKYRLLASVNRIANPDVITPGQQLTIPGVAVPSSGSRLVAVDDDAHLVVRFGVQNLYEQTTQANPVTAPPTVATALAANDSRVVFELPKGAEIPYTVAGLLDTLGKLGLRVPALAIPRVTATDPRPADAHGELTAPAADETAIEAPFRLVVSPNRKYGGFTHAALAESAPQDPNRVGLWHTRLGVRTTDAQGAFTGVDEGNSKFRTVRAVYTRDDDGQADAGFGSLKPADRRDIVKQTALPPTDSRPESDPLDVRRLYLSALGGWIDWRGKWGDDLPLSAYVHQAPMGRDQYVRVERPIYLYPFGHRATLIKLTERKIKPAGANPAADLYTRYFIVLREHTRDYTDVTVPGTQRQVLNAFPFKTITIDPVVSTDIDTPPEDPATKPFVPLANKLSYQWTITGVDHEGRVVSMVTPLVAVPMNVKPAPPTPPHEAALRMWNDQVIAKNYPLDLGGAEIAFAPSMTSGDTTSRVQHIEFTGHAAPGTSAPELRQASVVIPALAALNRGGGTSVVKYGTAYVKDGFKPGDAGQLYLQLKNATTLNFAGASDRGGGFVEPSVGVKALSRSLGAVGDDGSGVDGIAQGKFDPKKFLEGALPKLFGLFELQDIIGDSVANALLDEAPKLITEEGDLVDQTVRYVWNPKITAWPDENAPVFKPNGDDPRLPISVELRTSRDGAPESVISAKLPNFQLQLPPGDDALMAMTFEHIAFRTLTGAKPEVDVQFDEMTFHGVLEFVEKLRRVIPLDGFSDPPFVDINTEGATAGFSLALPSVAIGVFSLENIALGADCRIPFLGEAVTVGFFFCTKEAPFRLTVLAIGGGGWVGIRLSPMGLVLLEMGLEAGASLSVDLVVASGSVSVMVGVYLRLEDKKGQLTAYFRIRGEVEVLGIASASITLELSLRYDTDTGKLVGRASLTVEIEVAFFSASVEIVVERRLAGSKGDPSLKDVMPPDEGGEQLWNQYYAAFEIGA